jgi:meiotically up-regulated gene 157 (Mug157) protein
MVWSAFRASDDPQRYGYHIPDNMYVVGALERIQEINAAVWRDEYIDTTCKRLVADIVAGVNKFGVVTAGVRV